MAGLLMSGRTDGMQSIWFDLPYVFSHSLLPLLVKGKVLKYGDDINTDVIFP